MDIKNYGKITLNNGEGYFLGRKEDYLAELTEIAESDEWENMPTLNEIRGVRDSEAQESIANQIIEEYEALRYSSRDSKPYLEYAQILEQINNADVWQF